MRIDMHTHSTASDGTDSPAALMAAAWAAGLEVVALTDHDTTDGWTQAARRLPPGLTLVPGLELSCRWVLPDGGRPISLHMLGYLVDPDSAELRTALARLRESRSDRGRRMVENMAAAGLPISWEHVRRLAGSAPVGRPHLGRALVQAGLVSTMDEAFDRYLRPGAPYYVPKADLPAVDGIGLIRAAGGVPVFAHPLARRRGRVVGPAEIAAMADAGLVGLEVDHPDHEDADREALRGLARELGLLVTGSSDYHGANKVTRLGAYQTDAAVYEAVVAAASGTDPVTA